MLVIQWKARSPQRIGSAVDCSANYPAKCSRAGARASLRIRPHVHTSRQTHYFRQKRASPTSGTATAARRAPRLTRCVSVGSRGRSTRPGSQLIRNSKERSLPLAVRSIKIFPVLKGEPNGEPTLADPGLRQPTASDRLSRSGACRATSGDMRRRPDSDWGSRGRGFKSRRPDDFSNGLGTTLGPGPFLSGVEIGTERLPGIGDGPVVRVQVPLGGGE
jgi:hypothetical protein